MGYIDDESMVRVDFFKPSGKWYYTIGIKWLTYFSPNSKHLGEGKVGLLIFDAFEEALKEAGEITDKDREGWFAVCLKPYHEHSHPLMITL